MVEYALNNTLYYTIEDNTVKMCRYWSELKNLIYSGSIILQDSNICGQKMQMEG